MLSEIKEGKDNSPIKSENIPHGPPICALEFLFQHPLKSLFQNEVKFKKRLKSVN